MSKGNEESKYQIHEAVRDNKVLLVRHLVDENAKLLLLRDEDERTPLHWACSMNSPEIVSILLKARPHIKDMDIDDMSDLSGWTPLHIAASVGSLEITDMLMANDPQPDVNLPTTQGTTALHLAVSKNHYDLVKKLVIEYKSSCRIKDKKGFTPLHRAACIGSQPIINLLAKLSNVNAKDNDGWTSVHHALAEGHADVAVLLVSLGADPNALNVDGEPPVKVAVDSKVANFFTSNI